MAKAKLPPAKKGEKSAALDENTIIELIADGGTQLEIATKFGVSRGLLRHWLAADVARSARAREAASVAAQAYAEGALEVIRAATDPFSLAKAKEEAQHLRWAASKANSAKYGDKVTQEVTGANGGPVQVTDPERPKLSKAEWLALHGIGVSRAPG